jgi:hypothetical protein
VQVLEDLDDGERCAGEDTFPHFFVVQKPDILVHIEEVSVGEAFDIFVYGDYLLEVGILAGTEDRVIDYYTVDCGICICRDQGFFNSISVDGAKGERKAT